VRMLEAAHRDSGRLHWRDLLQPAIDRARDGFSVSPRLHALIGADAFLSDDPVAAAYFHDADGKPLAVGTTLRNPALARTLETLAREGSRPLYSGALAGAIVDKVRSHPRNPGLMTRSDLAAYQPRRREPVCAPWQRWIVCGMPPPSSGGIALAQMLQILTALPFRGLVSASGAGPGAGPGADTAPAAAALPEPALDPAGVHLFSEAGRLAFADRDRYVADSDFVPVPGGLLDAGYLRQRARLVGEQSLGVAAPGVPEGVEDSALKRGAGYEEGGTSHISVVDRYGNAASMTTSIENAFGSRQMVAGFLLNNQLTDFSFAAAPAAAAASTAPARPALTDGVRNRLQPGKRPRSSMTPTLVFEKAQPPDRDGDAGTTSQRGALVMATGSPGGAAIINYVAKTVVATLQDGLDPLQAIALPNIGSRNGPTELERGRVGDALVAALRARGHAVRMVDATSGVHSIVRRCDNATAPTAGGAPGCVWVGAADPRREGTARGG
jgi:gamma-glutamyltranspeptidase / glutathione hydrolase